jgi:hypothetical protein
MLSDSCDFGGPYYEPGLIGPDGRLTRLHKGGAEKPKPPPPPPATPDPDEEGAIEMEKRNQRRKKGMMQTQQGTLLGKMGGESAMGSSFQAGAPTKRAPTSSAASGAGSMAQLAKRVGESRYGGED